MLGLGKIVKMNLFVLFLKKFLRVLPSEKKLLEKMNALVGDESSQFQLKGIVFG